MAAAGHRGEVPGDAPVTEDAPSETFAPAGPGDPDFEAALRKIPAHVRQLLQDKLRGEFKYLQKFPPQRFSAGPPPDTTGEAL